MLQFEFLLKPVKILDVVPLVLSANLSTSLLKRAKAFFKPWVGEIIGEKAQDTVMIGRDVFERKKNLTMISHVL